MIGKYYDKIYSPKTTKHMLPELMQEEKKAIDFLRKKGKKLFNNRSGIPNGSISAHDSLAAALLYNAFKTSIFLSLFVPEILQFLKYAN